jgi:Helix-hairpin-helix motif
MVHTMYVSNGIEAEPPVEFLSPGSIGRGFIVINNMAYAAVNDCSGGNGGIRALDLTSRQVSKWDGTGEIAGSEGLAFGPDRTVFVTTAAGEMLALDGKTLEVKEKYTANQPFVTSPAVFQYRQRVLAVAATKDGSMHVVGTHSLGGDDHVSAVAKTPALTAGLTLRRSESAAILAYRSKHGPFKSIEDLKNVPGIDYRHILSKQDRITFE